MIIHYTKFFLSKDPDQDENVEEDGMIKDAGEEKEKDQSRSKEEDVMIKVIFSSSFQKFYNILIYYLESKICKQRYPI